MYIATFHTLDGVEWYGDAPEIHSWESDNVEIDFFQVVDWDKIEKEYVSPLNERCRSALWIGDYEFFDVDACRLILEWLLGLDVAQFSEVTEPIVKSTIKICKSAIDFGTGMKIEI